MSPITEKNGENIRKGRIEVICGSMFSGKTEELIRRMKRAKFARQSVEIFKPAVDTRYSEEDVVSHEGNSIPSTPIDSSASILLLASDTDVVGIDEAQFFDDNIVNVCNELAYNGTRVIVAGLDLDFKGIPFGLYRRAVYYRAGDRSASLCFYQRISSYRRQLCSRKFLRTEKRYLI